MEHRSLPRRHAVRADDKAELYAVAESLQNVPRESTASMADMLFLNRRMAKRIRAVADNLEPVEVRERVLRSWQAPAKLARPPEPRTIVSAKGRRVRVETRQLEMVL